MDKMCNIHSVHKADLDQQLYVNCNNFSIYFIFLILVVIVVAIGAVSMVGFGTL